VVAVVLAPIILPATLLVDAVRWLTNRTPFMSTRLYAFGIVYLFAEVAGVIALGIIWIVALGGRARTAYIDATYAVQRRWTSVLLGAAAAIFGLRISVENAELVTPGPLLVLARHASIVDNLLPGQLITGDARIRLRYVLKRELLSDPCLDIAGSRLPNYFVDREAGDPRHELEQIRALARDLTARDGVLIFPEGTRFTPRRQQRALAELEASDSSYLERARGFRHVLPPKLGGVSALLKTAPTADVVLLGHHGLEGFARVGDVWRGAMLGQTVRVRFWRHAAGSIPSSRTGRADWLFDQWAEIDGWIEEGVSAAS
jgi:1-acyl-sn-glycerol-3-phosphate acyltransferase